MEEDRGMARIPAASIPAMVRTERQRIGISQAELAAAIGTNQETIQKIESGKTKRSSFLPEIFSVLGISLDALVATPKKTRAAAPADVLLGRQDLRVLQTMALMPDGPRSALVTTLHVAELVTRPQALLGVSDAYAIRMVLNTMSPEFEYGDLLMVHPHLPPMVGMSCLFSGVAQPNGSRIVCVARLLHVTNVEWQVREWNPPCGKSAYWNLERQEWPICEPVVSRSIHG
jgi:transcriptional regulator with XRE-family HTH domain